MDLFDYVYDFLLEQRGWTKAQAIQHKVGVTPSEMRALCQEYPWAFISSHEGYRLTRTAPKSEIRACVQNLLGRAEKIIARASVLSARIA